MVACFVYIVCWLLIVLYIDIACFGFIRLMFLCCFGLATCLCSFAVLLFVLIMFILVYCFCFVCLLS